MPDSSSFLRLPAADHPISEDRIPPPVLGILRRLHGAGHQALLVGGCVRDLLLGREPNDFDVATDALPEQVRALFRSSRLIGRRFRLAHVRAGRQVIEVATFRRGGEPVEDGDAPLRTAEGRLLSDNLYGTIEEDARRRDFTVNALYWDVADGAVIDYVGGIHDIRSATVRVIGDPVRRYREDPVRMLRAVRVAAELGFQLDAATAAPMAELSFLLRDVPPARMFEECLKLFHRGCARAVFDLQRRHHLFEHLFPLTARAERGDRDGTVHRLVTAALDSTDERVNAGKPVLPAFLLATLLWPAVRTGVAELVVAGTPWLAALRIAGDQAIREQARQVVIPHRVSVPMFEIWMLQRRLEERRPKFIEKTLQDKRFRAAYDFLLLRCTAGEVAAELADWWTEIQTAAGDRRRDMLAALGRGEGGRSRRRRRRRPARAPLSA